MNILIKKIGILACLTLVACTNGDKAQRPSSPDKAEAQTELVERTPKQKYLLEQIQADLIGDNLFTTEEGKRSKSLALDFVEGETNIDQVVSQLQKAMKANDVRAKVWMGRLIETGLVGREAQLKTAKDYFEEAASEGDPDAMFKLALVRESASSADEVAGEALLAEYQKASELGSNWATDYLADAYWFGNEHLGVGKNVGKAIQLYGQAFNQGSLNGALGLAVVYLDDPEFRNVQKSRRIADELCRSKTVFGANGCLVLALADIYEFARNEPRDFAKLDLAEEKVTAAYEQSNQSIPAAAFLGIIYFQHYGRFKKLTLDAKYFLKKGCRENWENKSRVRKLIGFACVIQGDNSAFGNYGWSINKSHSEAESFYRRGLHYNFGLAFTSLASLYESDPVFSKNQEHIEKARELYHYAANKLNDPKAMFMIGWNYAHGVGVEKDMSKTRAWFGRSARLGYPLAMEGYARELARGDNPDYESCFMWGTLSKLRGINDLKAAELCAPNLSDSKRVELVKKAEQKNKELERPYALYNL